MAEQLGSSTSNSLLIVIPSRGETDWDQDIRNLCFKPISDHDHTGSGNGARITSNAIEDDAITNQKIQNDSISEVKLQDNSVSENKLQNSAVTTSKIADGAVTKSKLDPALPGQGLAFSSVTNKLDVQVDYLTISIDGNNKLYVPYGSITAAHLDPNVNSNLATIDARITSNDSDIAALDGRLTTAESNITSNDSDIASLDSRVTTSESNISLNNSAIILLDSRLTTAESDITLNSYDIITLQNRDIDSLSNVDATTPTNGDVLVYNSTSGKWESQASSSSSIVIYDVDTDTVPSIIENKSVIITKGTSGTIRISQTTFNNCTIRFKNQALVLDNCTINSSNIIAENNMSCVSNTYINRSNIQCAQTISVSYNSHVVTQNTSNTFTYSIIHCFNLYCYASDPGYVISIDNCNVFCNDIFRTYSSQTELTQTKVICREISFNGGILDRSSIEGDFLYHSINAVINGRTIALNHTDYTYAKTFMGNNAITTDFNLVCTLSANQVATSAGDLLIPFDTRVGTPLTLVNGPTIYRTFFNPANDTFTVPFNGTFELSWVLNKSASLLINGTDIGYNSSHMTSIQNLSRGDTVSLQWTATGNGDSLSSLISNFKIRHITS